MSKKYLKISKKFDFDIFSGGKVRVLKLIDGHLMKGTGFWQVATVNPEFVMVAKKDKKFRKILQSTDLNTTDGIGLVWAEEVVTSNEKRVKRLKKFWVAITIGVEILQGKHRNRIASGSELIVEMCKKALKKGYGVFFLGGFGDTASLAGKKINDLVGGGLNYETSPGRPTVNDTQVFSAIQKSGARILFVAYGMKKQEEWIYENRAKLEKMGVRLAMGVGRSFDYYAGKLAMAPDWIKKMGLEWLYSLIKDPKRLKRQKVLPKFVWEMLSKT